MNGPPIPWGCLRVTDQMISQVGTLEELRRRPDESLRDFPDAVLMPGLINAHCHLELGMVRNLLPPGEAFPMWVSRLRKALEGAAPEDYRQASRLGALECLKNGTTTVVDVGNTGESLHELASLPIRSFPYLEVIGLDPALAQSRLENALHRLGALPKASGLFSPGITGHAPYSCSPELLRGLAAAMPQASGPFTMHVAESAEEYAMFKEGKGALLDFCRRIFPGWAEPAGQSPIAFLAAKNALPRNAILAHCNRADAADIRILAEANCSVAHCPRSKAFFGHEGFPVQAMRDAGLNLCLGTDSLASNEGLSLFDEMAELHRQHPELPCTDIVAMATVNGAKALGRSGELGVLRPGAAADFIAITLRHHPEYDLFEEIVGESHEVLTAVVNGEEVFG